MDFKQYLKNQSLSRSTVEMYHYHTLDFIAFLDRDHTEVENASEKEVLLYLNHLQKKGLDNTTKKIRLYALKHFFDFQMENHARDDNPTAHIKITGKQTQKLYPILSPQELQKIYEQYPVPTVDDPKKHHNWFNHYRLSRERNKVILGLMVYQGITTAEAGRLQVTDLNLRKGEIDIKGARVGNDRTLDLQAHQIIDLMEYLYKTRAELLTLQGKPTEQLFLSVPGSGQTRVENPERFEIWKRLTQEVRSYQPKFINFLQVRTSVIVKWIKQYNLRQVQYRAGHKSIKSTELYLVNDMDDLLTEIDHFHPLE